MSNKYQEALKRLRTNEYLTSREQREYYNLLQELVDKETPRTEQEILKDFESLGHETKNAVYKYWRKGLIVIETFYERIEDYYVCTPRLIRTQEDIKKYQQAFDQLKKDLEELRKYEKLD